MFRNYFKTAWRNIVKSKWYSLLNVLGLASGMAVALLIGLWVYHESTYDRFLPDHNRIYQVKRNFNSNGEILTFETTSLKLVETLRSQVPEIEYIAESDWMGEHGLNAGEKKLYMRGGIAGTDFLKLFGYELVEGTAGTVFREPYSIVLSQSTAKALFGNENAINKTVRFDNQNDLKVTGILKDLPGNSSLNFNFLVPFTYLDQTNPRVKANRNGSFGNNSFQQFVKLKPNVSFEKVSAKIKDIEKSEDNTNAKNSDVIIQPFVDRHLYSEYKNGKPEGGFIEYVRMFSIIGALVLLIACINFINLTTARSEKRAREVGVRKAVGSQRKDLIIQFLMESFVLTLFSFIMAVVFVQLALPYFNALTSRNISIPLSSPIFWIIMAICIIVTTIVAGSRPAFYLSSFNPVKVLKGTFQTGRSGSLPRKVLVVIQFTCSIALIISTMIVYQQIIHAKNRPTGYNVNRLMQTNLNPDLKQNFAALKNELLQSGIVESLTCASSPATGIYWHSDIDHWPGKNAGETIEMGIVVVGEDYFKTLGMSMKEGRGFTNANDTLSIIFNEAAIAKMRIKNPVGQTINWSDTKLTIVGVAKDALMLSPYQSADPTLFAIDKGIQGNIIYRLSPNFSTKDAVEQLTNIFNKYNPAFPYTYKFVDLEYADKYSLEVLIGKLSGIFAALAIFISCLGLFGLAAYVAEQRTKEIGIRKVLGASVSQVWVLLSKDFIILVLISCLIATPLAFYFLQDWLLKYSYRISIGAGVFVLAGAMALVITIATISFQAIKAALANPVRSLRTE